MGSFAKFNATLLKVNAGKTSQIVLQLQHKDLAKNYLSLIESVGDEVQIAIGNPQASMEEYGVTVPERGRVVGTIGPGGVVETAKLEGEGQVELEDVPGEPDEDAPEAPYEVGDEDVEDEGGSFEDMTFDEDADGAESDAQELVEHSEQGEDGEGEKGTYEVAEDDQYNMIEPEMVEEFILRKRPAFEDIPYDFPALLERRKNGERWLDISSSIGVTSGTLQGAWSKYKTKVKQQIYWGA